ncbi:hypothetical protein [Bradyrhizobium sp. Gha]|uniref:hypothetical protein n=1 Tax=Bradyrhizobium sp. Gha TaxID=1855318 RepID=UPI001160CFE0|nr:hypothetical protein [Bradyrhizobium sp. Gha]
MRRTRRIVNEMEFRMWREAKSISPFARTATMKRFQLMHHPANAHRGSAAASLLRIDGLARRAFSKAAPR